MAPGRIRYLLLLAAIAASACAQPAGTRTDLVLATPPVSSPIPADPLADGDPLFEEDALLGPQVGDPLEPVNRPIFAGNMALDRVVIDPIARVYGWLVPDPVKTGIRGVFSNLNRPVVFVNELLQLEPVRAAQTLGRFALNSSLGIGGIFDPAAELGWTEHNADFGQTLGLYGVAPGIYHVFPLFGPSSTRDAVGAFVDMFMRPDTWLLPLTGQLMLGGGFGITVREDKRDELEELRKASLDYYAAIRSAYLQSREQRVREARERWD
jgi:phospholipid-binding lipoprotein MlaA